MKEVLTLSTQCLQPDHCGLLASCVFKKNFLSALIEYVQAESGLSETGPTRLERRARREKSR